MEGNSYEAVERRDLMKMKLCSTLVKRNRGRETVMKQLRRDMVKIKLCSTLVYRGTDDGKHL